MSSAERDGPGGPALLGVCLAGPTGAGKTALAMAFARTHQGRLPLEIISVDSAQVYRGMDIGTAKPSRAERERVPHHLQIVLRLPVHPRLCVILSQRPVSGSP